MLDLLGSLVDQSLVIAEERDSEHPISPARDRAPVRARAPGRGRRGRGDRATATATTTSRLAEQAGPHLETGRQLEWLELLDPEAANLAAAIEYALRSEPPLALRFCAALYRWWCTRGRFAEAQLAHSRSLEACGDTEPALRARAIESRAYVAVWVGDFQASEAHATEALALAEEVGDQGTAARARCDVGSAVQFAEPSRRASGAGSARPSSRGRRATTGRSWRPSRRPLSPTCSKANTPRPLAPTRRSPRWPSGRATPSTSPGAGSMSLRRLSSTVASPRRARRSSGCERRWRPPGSRSGRRLGTPSWGSSMSGRASPSARSSAYRGGSNAP